MVLRVVVADADRLGADGVRRVLNRSGRVRVVGCAATAAEVLPMVEELMPDALLLALDLPDMSFLDCIGIVRQRDPSGRVIVLADERDAHRIDMALTAGASACIVKSIDPDDLVAVICQALAGSIYAPVNLPAPSQEMGVEERGAALTELQEAMLAALCQGFSNREIGRQLWMTERMVESHLVDLFRELDVPNRTAAARYAHANGLLDRL